MNSSTDEFREIVSSVKMQTLPLTSEIETPLEFAMPSQVQFEIQTTTSGKYLHVDSTSSSRERQDGRDRMRQRANSLRCGSESVSSLPSMDVSRDTERDTDSYWTAEENPFLSPQRSSVTRELLEQGFANAVTMLDTESVAQNVGSSDVACTAPDVGLDEIDSDQYVSGNETTKVEILIGPQHFELLKLLGEGAFGKVVLVQNHFSRRFYAMKVISKKLLKKKNNISYMKSERDILTKLHHPFLINLHFAFQSSTKLFLVMDFLSGGELFLHLRRRGLILEHEVVFYLGEMILAIEFLHQKNIIHRDLKPENVLLRSDAHVCITDFGLAKEIGDGVTTRTLCGTSEYMAPEMLTRTGYGKAVDWWALGALCYEMLVGKSCDEALLCNVSSIFLIHLIPT
jgi:tRNA A-37 threonylcarbamoyl transferase component Bud32